MTKKTETKTGAKNAKISAPASKKNRPAEKTSRKTAAGKPVISKTAVKKAAGPAKTAADKGPIVKKAAGPTKNTAVKKAVASAKTAADKNSTVKKTVSRIRKDEILKKLRLSKADKKYFRELLLHARSAFGAQVQYHSDDALARKDAAGERAGMATHMADLGTDNYRRDFELGLLSDGVDVLEMIDEALQRLEDSEYGVCLDCGEPIPRKRLEAKPYAKYCTKCKSKREEMDETYYHRR